MRSLVLATVALLALVCFSSAQSTITGCGFAGLDFSSIGSRDLYYYDSGTGWNYVLRMCGSVTDAICLSDQTSVGSMVCQRGNNTNTNAYDLMRWRNNGADGVWGSENGGLFYQYSGGETCGATGGLRSTTVHLFCDTAATQAYISYVVERTTCQYHLYVHTNLACTSNPTCGFLGVDLSPIFGTGGSTDLTYVSNFNWYINLCGVVNFQGCRNDSTASASSICQRRLDGSDAFAIANFNQSAITWSVVPTGASAGLLAVQSNGEYCAAVGANRVSRVKLVCDRSLGSTGTYISGISEVSTCVYEVTVFTPYTCSILPSSTAGNGLSSSFWPDTNVPCVFSPANHPSRSIDFTSLKNGDDLLYDGFVGGTYYNVSFHMCGVTRNAQCLSDSTTYNSMVCQASITNSRDNWSMAYFQPSTMIWGETQYGVQFYQETGEMCGEFPRSITVEFQCISTATHAEITSMSEPQTCQYLMLVSTNIVCNGTNEKSVPVNDQPLFPNCIYRVGDAAYDFKTINPTNGDLSIVANSTGGTTYNIFLRMCSIVADVSCRSDPTSQKAMVCQRRLGSSGDAYSLADYIETNMIWGQVSNQQRIRLKMINGEYCSDDIYRNVAIDFICDTRYNRPTIISYSEQDKCQYQLVVAANSLMCGFNPTNPDGSKGSSSDNMNGGMVALIVLVIIFGLLLIIGACVAWRYYGRPYAFQKDAAYPKDVEMHHGEAGNTGYEHEESQSTV